MEWNLRVSAALHQGDRKYMEDQYAIHYECDKKTGKFLYVYFGMFDGHGGADAAKYAKAHLHKNITANILFFSKDPNDVLQSIEEGFLKTHEDMWKELGKWPTTATGLSSTAGTTASVLFIKDGNIYTGHVGDSGISIGSQLESLGRGKWVSEHLTVDHKPDSPAEKSRIESMGGKVIPKAGVPRVVWQRPREKGPVRRDGQVDHIPFLAVGRALGDLWSYNFENKEYAISPKPDVQVLKFNPYEHKCLVLASDGLWNLLDPKGAVSTVEMTDRKWFREAIYEKGYPKTGNPYYHHASTLVNIVLRRWRTRCLRADNTSAIVVMIDPPGPTVHDSLTKLTTLSQQMRNRGQKFCARSYLKEHEQALCPSERYILGMTGSYNIQYYEDRDRFELHFGKPAVRYDVPADFNTDKATSSITMFDVIIHKVMTPCKSTGNIPGLYSSLSSASSTHSFSRIRKAKSSKDLRVVKSSSSGIMFGSWLDEDTEGDSPPEEFDPGFPDNLPGYMDEEENVVSKTPEALNNDHQPSDSPTVELSLGNSKEEGEMVSIVSRLSPDSTTGETCSPPLPPVVSTTISAPPVTSNTNKPHPILRRLRGVAKSLVSLHDSKKPSKPDSTTKGMNLRRTGRKPAVVGGSPLKKKRHSNGVDLSGIKRQKLAITPCARRSKTVPVSSLDSRICLRSRQK